jgi:hypothetical protein
VEEQMAPPSGGGLIPTPSLHIPKAHQRLIREQHAAEVDPVIDEKRALAQSLSNASVREIDRSTAKEVILKYEWLGTMGTTDFQFGLYFGEYLAGVVCFGRTAGTKTAESICGKPYKHRVKVLNRGACVHWAHPHSASFLIAKACRLMAEKGFNIFVAYSDTEAGEIGTVYQATNWLYCGMTNSASSMFVWSGKPTDEEFKDGIARDERCIQHSTRMRSSIKGGTTGIGAYRTKCSRRERRRQLVAEGFVFYKTSPKHRYVNIVGDRDTVAVLRGVLRWETCAYPKRRSKKAGAGK